MECNKEEAIRAKGIAETKMQSKDFSGAKRIALKAQQLYPDLENISQLLTVCEVHCSAATNVNGLTDWYDILQVEPTADDISIKKQYRKLALLLHPDKNKFAGAESAFKLIGEAHRTLADHSKRSLYDSKRTHYKAAGVQIGGQQQQSAAAPTFWTFCPFCKIRYQYYRTIMNRPIRCQTCLQTFVAYDMDVNSPFNSNSGVPPKQPGFGQQKGFSAHSAFKTNTANQFGSAPSNAGFHGKAGGQTGNKVAEEKQVHNDPRKKSDVRFEEVKLEKKDEKKRATRTSTIQKQKRPREKTAKGSKDKPNGNDNSDSDIEIVTENSNGFSRKNAGTTSSENRRSSREKAGKYTDDQSGHDGLGSPPKKSRNHKIHHYFNKKHAPDDVNDVGIRTKVHKEHSGETVGSNSKKDVEFTKLNDPTLSYPDSEFHDFFLARSASSFKEGQIWAVYDDYDGMPRYYAKIMKVSSPCFQAKYTWLEFIPEGQTAKQWFKADFPVACGTYRLGKTERTTEIAVFSHLMSCEKGARKNDLVIKPRKGEVWALYKSWDISWLSSPDKHQPYEYDIVEILSDGAESAGVSVVPLVKVKGFVSVFTRAVSESVTWIPTGELLRFSHLVPSFRVTVSEIEGIPEASYELDPGSLPGDFEKKFPSITLDVKKAKSNAPSVQVDNCQTSETEHQKSESETHNDNKAFHDFQSEKTMDKFKSGQIWALYSDFDTFPKYYALVTATTENPREVHVTWLDSCPESEDEKMWYDKDLPLSTGKFKLASGKNSREVFDTVHTFSHLISNEETGRKIKFDIYPQTNQIWALYRNWSVNWEESDLKGCEYDIAWILYAYDSKIKIVLLIKVEGYDSIYMPEKKNGAVVILEIPRTEMLRFSHQVPAYQLKGQNGGRLHGHWELDPNSLPGA